MVASLKPFVIKLIDFGQAAFRWELTQPLKIDTIHIFNQRVSMVNLLDTDSCSRPLSTISAPSICRVWPGSWSVRTSTLSLHVTWLSTNWHLCFTDVCKGAKKLRAYKIKKILESSGAVPLCSNSRCSTFAAAEAKTLTTTSVYTPPEVKAKTAVPFSEVLRSIFSMGFWPRCSCPWHGRNKDVRFFWLRESHEVFLLTLTSRHWYVLEDNRQQR